MGIWITIIALLAFICFSFAAMSFIESGGMTRFNYWLIAIFERLFRNK